MITGDHRLTAMAIGREIGLISGEAPILACEEMEQLSNRELTEVLARGCQIFARTTPRQKLRLVSVLKDIGEIVPYLAFILLGIPLPLTIIQILAIDLGTDTLPALALGAEPPAGDTMRSPPRPRGEPLLTSAMLLRAYAFLGPIEAAAAMTSYFYILFQGGWIWGQVPPSLLYQQATTACLTAIIVMQVANGFVCRSPRVSLFSLGLFTNRMLLVGMLVEVGLQLIIVYSPFGQQIFRTAALPLTAWLVAMPFALALFVADEGRKALARRLTSNEASNPSIFASPS